MDNNTYIIVECPHCHETIQLFKNDFNCKIFRHGVYKSNYNQIDPHLVKNECEKLKNNNEIFGCGKPFKLINENEIIKCDYI